MPPSLNETALPFLGDHTYSLDLPVSMPSPSVVSISDDEQSQLFQSEITKKNQKRKQTPSSSTSLSSSPSDTTVLPETYQPSGYDVLCGRHKKAFNNIGNRRLRVVVASFLDEYLENTCRKKRSGVITSVMNVIEKEGGKFLKSSKVDSSMTLMTKNEIRDKIGHALRDAAAVRQSKKQAGPSKKRKKRNVAFKLHSTTKKKQSVSQLQTQQEQPMTVTSSNKRQRTMGPSTDDISKFTQSTEEKVTPQATEQDQHHDYFTQVSLDDFLTTPGLQTDMYSSFLDEMFRTPSPFKISINIFDEVEPIQPQPPRKRVCSFFRPTVEVDECLQAALLEDTLIQEDIISWNSTC